MPDPVTPPPGVIPLCPHKGCAFKCCNFQQMAHIVMYPGELEAAVAQGKSVGHLQVLDANFHGGVSVRCRAQDTSNCDHGYKPLDCVSYPFFPELSPAPAGTDQPRPPVTTCKGAGCPIASHEIPYHERFVRETWQRLVDGDEKIAAWLVAFGSEYTDSVDPEPYAPI